MRNSIKQRAVKVPLYIKLHVDFIFLYLSEKANNKK